MIKTDKVIYRTRTQEEYDWLMEELDKADCMWIDGEFPTESNVFSVLVSDTYIIVDNKELTYGKRGDYGIFYDGREYIKVSDLMEKK